MLAPKIDLDIGALLCTGLVGVIFQNEVPPKIPDDAL